MIWREAGEQQWRVPGHSDELLVRGLYLGPTSGESVPWSSVEDMLSTVTASVQDGPLSTSSASG